jgi:hypothetical protein
MAENENPAARIEELNGRLTELSADELTELRGLVQAQIEAAEAADLTSETVEQLTTLADIAVAVGGEDTRRAEAAAALQASRDEALSRARGAITTPEPDEPEQPETDQAVEPEREQQPEPVAASASRRPLTAFRQPAASPVAERPAERPAASGVRAALVAGGRDMSDDSEEAQLLDLSGRFATAMDAQRQARGAHDGQRFIVASARWDLPGEGIDDRISAEVARARMDNAYRAQLTAGGGICRPVTVDYNIPTWVNTEQPVGDALPSISAPRGGLQYANAVPYDATVYGPGVSIWTAANDVSPGGSNTGPGGTGTGPTTKPCIEIDCSSFTEVDVEAITQCLTVGNMRARFSPENVQMAMGYLNQAFAAAVEKERLRQMRSFAKHQTFSAVSGATRDILSTLDMVNAYFRSRYRLSANVQLKVVLMRYVREVIRIDLAKAAFPFEGDLPGTSLGISDMQIDSWFTARSMSPVWALDDDLGDQSFAAASAGTQGSPATFPVFPLGASSTAGHIKIRALVYPEGTYQRLDGGQLDLGVVRDSALNAVNKYQIFSEVFEAIAPRGFEALDLRLDVFPSGAASGTITPA